MLVCLLIKLVYDRVQRIRRYDLTPRPSWLK